MQNPFKIVSNQISPNLKMGDFWVGIRGFVMDEAVDFSGVFGHTNYKLANAARVLLSQVIEVLVYSNKRIKKKKTVGIPAFCCSVMASPFLSAGFEIIWLDTNEKGLLDEDDFLDKSEKISILLAPHIFGQKLNIKKLARICREKNIFLIEDGALFFDPKKNILNSEADLLWVSFGREKDFSCVSGGGIFWTSASPYAKKFEAIEYGDMPLILELKHLFQIFVFNLTIPFWYLGGKVGAFLAQKLKLLPLVFAPEEKKGLANFPAYSLPGSLQKILQKQFKERKVVEAHRKILGEKWSVTLKKVFPEAEVIIPKNCLRVIVRFGSKQRRDMILAKARKKHFFLQEWNGDPIAPKGIVHQDFNYKSGDCSKAEEFNDTYLTLPTNIQTSFSDIDKFEQVFCS